MGDESKCGENTQRIVSLEKRQKNIENKVDDLSVRTPKTELLMDMVINTNKEQTKALNELSLNSVKTASVLEKIEENLQGLKSSIENTNYKVDKLEEKIQENESKNSIDIRDIQKKQIKNVLKKYWGVIPLATLVAGIILKGFNII